MAQTQLFEKKYLHTFTRWIMWKDTGDYYQVIFAIGDANDAEDDDEIFYYFHSEEEYIDLLNDDSHPEWTILHMNYQYIENE